MDSKGTLLDALKRAPENHGIFADVEETISRTGLTVEEINEILMPYKDSILSGNGLSEEEIQELASKLLSE